MVADNNSNKLNRDRLLWSCRRGMLELDLLLKDFIYKGYETLELDDQKAFSDLLDYPDAVLFDLLMGKSITADQGIASVVKKIRTIATSTTA
ncbi:MAG: succinate dehydrogenase assembly factor 2 [Gammaproteobacteria bacterium]|nr:succinate dehydrogenase assembly factor 2 [Gammaproteobacteria bacterium]